jgi:GxxExxY protein
MKRRGAEGAEELHNLISNEVIGAAIEVHRVLGPGLLESSYARCLARELTLRDVEFRREVRIPIAYKGIELESGYRIDFLVEGLVVVELKTVDSFQPIHLAQLLTYLRLSDRRLGLLLNFNVQSLRNGIRRVAHHL